MTRTLTEKLLLSSRLDDQIQLELGTIEDGVRRYHRLAADAVRRGDGATLKPAERLALHWFKPLVSAIRQGQRRVRSGKTERGSHRYGPMLLSIDAPRAAVVVMHQTIGGCMQSPDGTKVAQLAYAIGRDIAAEIHLDRFRKTHRVELDRLDDRYHNVTPQRLNWWAWQHLSDGELVLQRSERSHLGAWLLWQLISTASITDYDGPEGFVLAFHHYRRREGAKRPAYIRMDSRAFDIIDAGHSIRSAMRPRYVPMIVQPMAWSEDTEGGYVRIRTPLVSKPTPQQKEALAAADLSEVYEGVNAMGSVPFQIVCPIHAHISACYESGGGMANIPLNTDRPLPPTPPRFDASAPRGQKWKRVRRTDRESWKKQAAPVYDFNIKLRGRRLEFVQKLQEATRQLNTQAIYFPHQMDFRGRAYPIPLHLNHQGDDVCRGLLMFAEQRQLTERGRFWLRVHAANCYGVDKVSFADREQWTLDHWDDIERSAADPAQCDFWIHADKGDKPWQFLAACLALMDDEIGSRLPIQADGTCNGLQHYTAMGRDAIGARAVNLIPAEQPNRIYRDVADKVRPMVQEDEQNSGKSLVYKWRGETCRVPLREIAAALVEHIDDDLIKQPVMTTVYGVTMVGARKQVAEKLKKRMRLDPVVRYRASMYLSKLVLTAMAEVCPAACDAMDWMRRVARIIARPPHARALAWTSPIGLPVVQPYRNWRKIEIRTILQRLKLQVESNRAAIATGKQIDGFAPNFVHSLDASHMIKTAIACKRQGIAFAAVHDSFWTHASDADTMHRLLREQFIELHREPQLEVLREQIQKLSPDIELPAPPAPGDLDINVIADSPYMFS